MSKCAWHKTYSSDSESNCLTCLRRNLSLFSELETEDLTLLNENKGTLYFSKNEQIFKQGTKPSGIYALSGGKAKNVRINEIGNEQIISLHKPVDFLGFYDFISDQNHSFSSIALENCIVCYIPINDFLTIINRNISFTIKTLKYVSEEFAKNVIRTSNLKGKHMRGRMADSLLYIYEMFEVQNTDDVLEIELTRQDYADMANMNTANAIRTLSEFSKTNWITLEKKRIIYRDIQALQRVSMAE